MHFVLQHFFNPVLIYAECLRNGQADSVTQTAKPLWQPQKELTPEDQ